jgi:hypothetical protein
MHAVIVQVTVNDPDAAASALHKQVVPEVSQAPEFVAGYWTRKGSAGMSMIIFGSEQAAQVASERVRGMVPEAVKLVDVEVREVIAHA